MTKTVLHDGDDGVLLIVKEAKSKQMKTPQADAPLRSPVHVVYGGAHLFRSDTPAKLGSIAEKTLETYAPTFVEFADAMWLKGCETLPGFAKGVTVLEKQLRNDENAVKTENYAAWFAWTVYQRTLAKLRNEPVEDFRIDFEDGYGFRTDDDEDADAAAAAKSLADAFIAGSITHFSGFRVKAFASETRSRAVRTLNLFLETFLENTGGKLPDNFVVTLPKVSGKKEVARLCKRLNKIEKRAGLHQGSIGVEIMIEHPNAIFDKKGNAALLQLVKAAGGRCTSAHFGTYDYTASLGIAASHQHLRHDACNFARQMMLAVLAPVGVRLTDGATTQMPVAIHKGSDLPEQEQAENKRSVISGWRTHFNNVTRSMIDGFYQSWDLHPNQLAARYAAVYAFFLDALDEQATRLRDFAAKATRANLTGNTFDDAATALGIVNFFLKGIDCGALREAEVEESTGLSIAELRSASFLKISENRRGSSG